MTVGQILATGFSIALVASVVGVVIASWETDKSFWEIISGKK